MDHGLRIKAVSCRRPSSVVIRFPAKIFEDPPKIANPDIKASSNAIDERPAR